MPEKPALHPPARGGNGKDAPDMTEHARNLPRIEATDVSARAMVRWGIGLIAFTAMSMLLVFGYYAVLHGPIGKQPLQRTAELRLPPWPRLQSNPARDIRDYRREQAHLAESYGWIDQNRGIVRMPVARARELVLERGLPVWSAAQAKTGEKQ